MIFSLNKIKTFTPLQKLVKITFSIRFYPPVQHITLHSKILIPKYSMHQLALFKVPSTSTMLCPRIQYYFPLKFKFTKNIISTNKFIENKPLDIALSTLTNKISKPFSDKPKNLRTFNNKEYETFLTVNTTLNDITEEQLTNEMIKRELVKQDNGKTAAVIKLQDNTDHLLGDAKNGLKLTQVGQAYVENFVFNTKIKGKNSIELPKFSTPMSKENFKIIVPPKSGNDCFIETGKQKHLLVVVDENNRIFPVCYLTSKSSGETLSLQQFKDFQNQKETLNFKITNKQQNYVKFKQFTEIDQNDVKYVKWDQEYLQNITPKAFAELRATFEILLKQERCEFYNNKGIMKEDCLKMCIEHDKIAEKKGAKHPLSADQIKQNKFNTNKQDELNTNKQKGHNTDVQ